MLDWNVETKHNCFQGSILEGIIKSMIQFYAEDNQDPEEILSIEAYQDGEIIQQLSETEINSIYGRIEREVRNWKRESEFEYQGRQQIRSEYRANLI